jgi:hypothetical protein
MTEPMKSDWGEAENRFDDFGKLLRKRSFTRSDMPR